ncbi:hypothetical protein BSR28_02150 [Boudabousia liubingyangii]|uniref:hypothetical protein n=1 Tax=Boudabousia liubingyangii TaxID=1921764 RepID=UPI00093D9D45|nr:hypothetical protein [Boudabousia liubingyangii]OKL48513.1 hypothetical protein BSR28_02150 [Boudabousia liubingyangii]
MLIDHQTTYFKVLHVLALCISVSLTSCWLIAALTEVPLKNNLPIGVIAIALGIFTITTEPEEYLEPMPPTAWACLNATDQTTKICTPAEQKYQLPQLTTELNPLIERLKPLSLPTKQLILGPTKNQPDVLLIPSYFNPTEDPVVAAAQSISAALTFCSPYFRELETTEMSAEKVDLYYRLTAYLSNKTTPGALHATYRPPAVNEIKTELHDYFKHYCHVR